MSHYPFILPVAAGGTGAKTAETARNALGACGLLSTTTGIDGTSNAAVDLYTVPSGKSAIPRFAVLRPTAVNSFVSVGTGGVGTNAGQDNMLAAIALTGLSATGKAFIMTNDGLVMTIGAAGETIKFALDVAFVVGAGGFVTLSLDLWGYLF